MSDIREQTTAFLMAVCRRTVKPLGAIAAAGMWVVLIMGATVTNTGSQTGCGPSWPLCRGQFIPQFAVSTFIEFSHRAVVGIESVLILAFAVAAWVLYHRRPDVRFLVATMVLFLFLQAGLGAWAVMAPQEAAVLALHFGVSLIAFATVVLAAFLVFEIDGADQVRDRPYPSLFGMYVWVVTIFSYGVVYLGAYVRHRNADDACTGWPLCNGRVMPNLHGLVGPAFAHRLAALVLTLGVGGIILWSARFRESRPDLFRASLAAGILVLLQALSGALVAATRMDLFSALAHAGTVALLFGSLSYLCLHLTRRPAEKTADARAVSAPAAAQRLTTGS
ncbi:MAG TPA: heme A synthase [Chloroflexota bacterium]|nr:heme A synthase [Chloroflexota bacterium]